ncbi:phage tail tape measure protein [Butyricicoccus sp.]|uniref:phage tail tape measure protein n=1 Tax=Butyricicoccus sp. TaxID=2049021 RepID=UPI003F1708DF
MSIQVATEEAKKKLESFGDSTDQQGSKLKSFGKAAGTLAAAGVTALASAAAATAVKSVQAYDSMTQGLNDFSAQTGISADASNEWGSVLQSIYSQNYGDDFRDIGDAMATVAQQARDTDPSNIEQLTINCLALRDTFDYDVGESMRTANMLMDQFGMSGDEAFNLIAQGAQNGLDKNGDLLDSINEYSVHFAQLGLDAEDMFNMLANGAESGTFSVDKLGDAVKEFGIRVKDGTADNAFKELGMDVEATKQAFASGGDAAKSALQDVTTKLFEMQDPVEQNQLGVEMFGTMWEDLGAAGVQALMDMNGEMDRTADSMNQIKDIKYDSLSEGLEGLGRVVTTSVLVPIGEQLVPLLEQFVQYIYDNMPQIQATVSGVMSAVAGVIGAVTPVVQLLIDAISALVTSAQTEGTAFNLAWEAMSSALAATLDAMKAVVGIFAAVLTGDWSALWQNVKSLLSSVLTALSGLVTAGMAAIVGIVSAIASRLYSAAATAFGKIKEGFSSVWGKIKSWVSEKIGSIPGIITGFGSRLYNAGSSIFNSLWNGLKSIWDSIRSWVSDKVAWIADKLTFWNNSKNQMNGSHRNGLRTVPYDGYIAELHKGEMVLTAAEARRYQDSFEQPAAVTEFPSAGRSVPVAGSVEQSMEPILQMMKKYFPRFAQGTQLVLNTGVLIGEIVDPLDAALGEKYNDTNRGRK